ncbi:hypothetical protein BYT27DRAFT_7220271 [Phlegmacium glaucopus]|nr:hypothetical protein BYT27DRAFT_7220271 [Phlegmacium glaucopus]
MPSQSNARSGVSFFQMVAGAMALLKLKEKYDQYRRVSGDDEEGRVALNSTYVDNSNDEGGIALLDTELPTKKARKTRGCCMCCGLDCSLFWKAIAIVLGLYTIYYGIKAVRWSLTPKPTGLENMPVFSTSLGCMDAPHLYNGSKVTFTAPMGTHHQDHGFDARGGAVGTFTLADGEADAQEIKYEMVLRASDEALLKDVYFDYPEYNDDKIVTKSRVLMTTPHGPVGSCVRFDITMFVPPSLKKLHVALHTTTHVQFAPGAHINTQDLFVTLYSLDSRNIIAPGEHVTSQIQALEAYRGWIVGDASIVKETSITTQRGDGVANVKLHPSPPSDSTTPEPATLRTITGAGRSDFFYIGQKAFKRPIDSTHTSSRNGDMYLTYTGAEFSGKIEMAAKSYSMTGAQKIAVSSSPIGNSDEKIPTWTHFVGDVNGGDKISVSSRGWTGLYF